MVNKFRAYRSFYNKSSHLLVILHVTNKLHEYTTRGELIREISLHDNIEHLYHAIELSTGQFVLCHGSALSPLHRVCIVDTDGHVVTSYGTTRGSADGQLN